MSRYEKMSREAMLDTVTGYTDDEASEKMEDRTTAVDEFMDLARDAKVPEPTMPEPPAPPSVMSKLKGSVNVPEEFKFADDTLSILCYETYTEERIYLSPAHPAVVKVV